MSPASTANSDCSDDEELNELLEQDKRRSERLLSKIVDVAPEPNAVGPLPKGTSVFGSTGNASTRQTDRQMASIMRERMHREELKKEIAELKAKQAESTRPKLSQEEKVFAELARAETRYEGENLRKFDKYFAPIALFLGPVASPPVVKRYWEPEQLDLEPLHLAILNAHRNQMPLNSTFLFLMSHWCEHRGPPPQYVGRMLFSRVVYDPTAVDSVHCRRHELQALLVFIRHACTNRGDAMCKPAKLPPMIQVLRTFGAQSEYKAMAFDAIENAPMQCLDRQIVDIGKDLNAEFERLLRNLGRSFKIWTELVNVNADLCGVLGEATQRTLNLSEKAVYCHDIAMLCVRVLLSPFGSRLGNEIGPLISAAFNTVNAEEWDTFRRLFARAIMKLTPRAGLLADLVIYLLPFCSNRARAVGLDVGYMIMWRWHRGPPECPRVAKIPESWPVTEEGEISFSLEDVVNCMEGIPELVPKTDVVWAQLFGRLLKFVMLEHAVLETMQKGQLARIQSAAKRIAKFSHRLPYGVPKSSFLYSMDTLIRALKAFVGPQDDGEVAFGGR